MATILLKTISPSEKGGFITREYSRDEQGNLVGDGRRGRVIIITRAPRGQGPREGDLWEFSLVRENPGSTLIAVTRLVSTAKEREAAKEVARKSREAIWAEAQDRVYAQLTPDAPYYITVADGVEATTGKYYSSWTVRADGYARTLRVVATLQGVAASVERAYPEFVRSVDVSVVGAEVNPYSGFALVLSGAIADKAIVSKEDVEFLDYVRRGTEVFARFAVHAPSGDIACVELKDGDLKKGVVSLASNCADGRAWDLLRTDPRACVARLEIGAAMEAEFAELRNVARTSWKDVDGSPRFEGVPRLGWYDGSGATHTLVPERLAKACVFDQSLVRPTVLPEKLQGSDPTDFILDPFGDIEAFIVSRRSEYRAIDEEAAAVFFRRDDEPAIPALITSVPGEDGRFAYTAEIELSVRVDERFHFVDEGSPRNVGMRRETATLAVEVGTGEVSLNGVSAMVALTTHKQGEGNLSRAMRASGLGVTTEVQRALLGRSVYFTPPKSARECTKGLEDAMEQILDLAKRGAVVSGYVYSDAKPNERRVVYHCPYDEGAGVVWHLGEMIIVKDGDGEIAEVNFDRRKGGGSLKANFRITSFPPRAPRPQELVQAMKAYAEFGWPVVRDSSIPMGQPLGQFLGIEEEGK